MKSYKNVLVAFSEDDQTVTRFSWSCLILKGETKVFFLLFFLLNQYRTQITTNIQPYLNVSTCVKQLFKDQDFGGASKHQLELITCENLY